MASPAKIREALIRLMGAKDTVKRHGDIDRFMDDDVDFAPSPRVMETTGDELRNARQQAREVQGVDPLTTKFPEEGMIDPQAEDIFGESVAAPLEGRKFRRDVSKDPSRLPDAEVPGSNEAITLFETLMQGNEFNPQMMNRLQQINPELADIARKQLRSENLLPPGMDEIPF
jgi:hypothetical protein